MRRQTSRAQAAMASKLGGTETNIPRHGDAGMPVVGDLRVEPGDIVFDDLMATTQMPTNNRKTLVSALPAIIKKPHK